MRRLFWLLTAAVAVLVIGGLPAATAGGSAPEMVLPTQVTLDGQAPDDSTSGYWGDMTGGNAARPYLTSLSVTTGGQTTQLVTDGTTHAQAVGPGDVTAIVNPVNLCRSDQTPSTGQCYSTPNRVQVTLAYGNGSFDGENFGAPQQTLTTPVDATTVVDMTLALNTLGQSLRWTWVNGDLLYWHTANLGTADATIEVKFRPAIYPWVDPAHLPAGNGCTATPPTNCSIAHEDGEMLTASLVLSLDDTLDSSLTGAAFATQRALFGYLEPSGTADAPSLDISMASTHLEADGTTPQLGTLQAFVPNSAILNLYGALPADGTTVFSTTRSGDAGTNGTPTYTPWTSAANGSDGLFVTVPGITFSVPQYLVKTKLQAVTSRATTNGAKTVVTGSLPCASAACAVAIYDLGPTTAPHWKTTAKLVFRAKSLRGRTGAFTLASSKLPANHRYLLYVRNGAGKAIGSSLGTVRKGALPTERLAVSSKGTGAGRVSSTPHGISCSSSCHHAFAAGSVVTLHAVAAHGSRFAGWSNACSGKRPQCMVTMDAAKSVTATFALRAEKLTVSRSGPGKGTVTSSPDGIDCGSTCSAHFGYGAKVTLTAAPAHGSRFAGWSGPCSGTRACTVSMKSAKAVTARFSRSAGG